MIVRNYNERRYCLGSNLLFRYRKKPSVEEQLLWAIHELELCEEVILEAFDFKNFTNLGELYRTS